MVSHDDELLKVLIDRNPNGMRLENLRRVLKPLTDGQIQAAAEQLETRGVISIKQHSNRMVPGRVIRTYSLTTPDRYPVRESVQVGDIEFPRAFQGDTVGAEDLNSFIEALAEYNATVESRVQRLAEHLTRRYWVNTATLLGLFVAVFALIAKGSDALSATSEGSALDLFWRNTAALAPLAVILFGFVIALWLLLRRP